MAMLTERQIAVGMKTLRRWKRNGSQIYRTVVHKDFVHAMGFVQSVALLAEKLNHHPDIDIRWNKVKLALTTHDSGGLTTKDFDLAAEIDRAAAA